MKVWLERNMKLVLGIEIVLFIAVLLWVEIGPFGSETLK